MQESTPSRRGVLGALASGGAAAIAGCATGPTRPLVKLFLIPVPAPLHEHLRLSYDGLYERHQRHLVRSLLQRGTVTTSGYSLVPLTANGRRTVARPRFVTDESDHYRLTVTEINEAKRDRWVFWFRFVGTRPSESDRTVVGGAQLAERVAPDILTSQEDPPPLPFDTSPLDRRVLERALRSVIPGFLRRVGAFSPVRRGYVFRQASPEQTVLSPQLPFDYLSLSTTDGVVYFEPVLERYRVTERRYHYGRTRVAGSDPEYRRYVERELVQGRLSSGTLPAEALTIVGDLTAEEATTFTTGGQSYTERAPVSSAFRALLEQCGFERYLDLGRNAIVGNHYVRHSGTPHRGVLKLVTD